MDEELSLIITTVQAGAIRILFEALKDVLTDVNIHVNSQGLKIISMDGSKSAIVHLKLLSTQFEKFQCSNNLILGVNMISMYKILKSIKNNDVVSFFVGKDTTILNIKIENKDKQIEIVSSIKLLDIDECLLSIPQVDFESVLNIPSNDFQNYIRDLSIISNELTIQTTEDELLLKVDGDFASQCIKISKTINCLNLIQCKPTSNTFNLKYLLLFTKSSNLCNNIEIYLKTDFPLILVYNVANLGQLKFCLAPLNKT